MTSRRPHPARWTRADLSRRERRKSGAEPSRATGNLRIDVDVDLVMDATTRPETRSSTITRRKFLTAAGSALALASIPLSARIARASTWPATKLKFGAPTPNSKFYVTSYASTPTVDVNSWNFTVKGMVENPLRFSYADIRRLPPVDQMLTLES